MVLWVYAMWSQSKRILCLLLFIYVPQVIVSFVLAGLYSTGTYLSGMSWINFMCHSNLIWVALHLLPPFPPVTILHIMDLSLCDASMPVIPGISATIPWLVLDAMLFILAITQTLMQSVNMYKATKQWQPNWYMKWLARDGILYFLVYVLAFLFLSFLFVAVTFAHPPWSQVFVDKLTTWLFVFFWTNRNMLFSISALVAGNNTWTLFPFMFSCIMMCFIMPQFVISLQELYEHDLPPKGTQWVIRLLCSVAIKQYVLFLAKATTSSWLIKFNSQIWTHPVDLLPTIGIVHSSASGRWGLFGWGCLGLWKW